MLGHSEMMILDRGAAARLAHRHDSRPARRRDLPLRRLTIAALLVAGAAFASLLAVSMLYSPADASSSPYADCIQHSPEFAAQSCTDLGRQSGVGDRLSE